MCVVCFFQVTFATHSQSAPGVDNNESLAKLRVLSPVYQVSTAAASQVPPLKASKKYWKIGGEYRVKIIPCAESIMVWLPGIAGIGCVTLQVCSGPAHTDNSDALLKLTFACPFELASS